MTALLVFVTAAAAGFVQSVTGFGCAVVMMVVFPHLFDMLQAPALTSAIAFGLAVGLSWRFRAHVEARKALPMAATYVMMSTVAINLARGLDLERLTMVFGLFLMLLSAYYLFMPGGMRVGTSLAAGLPWAAVAGVTGGLFGIGGPLLVIYFLNASRSKESYIANLQMIYLFSNFFNTLTRTVHGIYTWELVPLTLLGVLSINLGKMAGLRVLDRIDIVKMKTLVYLFIGISGAINVAEYFL